jgi:hypothetical protein
VSSSGARWPPQVADISATSKNKWCLFYGNDAVAQAECQQWLNTPGL